MRKEVILAIIIGVILGAIILYGMKLANDSTKEAVITEESSASATPNPTPTTTSSLVIHYPLDHSVLVEKSLSLSGNAEPSSTLAIVTEAEDLIIEADSEGNFTAEINLISGENTITVSQAGKDKVLVSRSITVIQTNTLPE